VRPPLERWRERQQQLFPSDWFVRHNQRRQEHLATLGLPLAGRTVLEVGAGIGDHSSFFLDRGCDLTISEARSESVDVIRERYPGCRVLALDLDAPGDTLAGERFDVVYAYGILYHLSEPREALSFLAERCGSLLLLETCVSFGDESVLNPVPEPAGDLAQSFHGTGCRPTRPWVFNALEEHFRYVTMPRTQPWHPEFPLDWTAPVKGPFLTRAIFVASRERLHNDLLVDGIPLRQERC
jgi:hypothetical protein